MNAELSTLRIEEELDRYMKAAYPALYKEYVLFTIAMVIACVIIPMFIIRVLGKYERRVAETQKKPCKAYLFRSTAKLGLHYTLIIFLLVLAIRRLYYGRQLEKRYNFYGKGLSLFGLFLLLFTLIAVFHLFKFHSRGLIETSIVMVFSAVYKHWIWLRFAKEVISGSADYKVVARYGFYIMVDSMFARSMAVDALVFGIIIFFTFYYYKRRFLFTPEKLHMAKCVHCGKAIIKGDSFCTCCGTQVTVEPKERLIEPLDEVKHCRKCGRFTNHEVCIVCDTQDYLQKRIKEKTKEKYISIARGVVLSILFFILLLIPQGDKVSRSLQKGSGTANNVFVSRWEEFAEQPNSAADPVWLAGFDADLNALYTVDSRWYYVKPRMVLRDKLWFYTLYAEASFIQMEVLEDISEFVHDAAHGQMADDVLYNKNAELRKRFNAMIDEQERAGIPCDDATSPWDIVGLGAYLCFDGLNYYLYGISAAYVSIFIMAVCLIMFIYMLNSFSNTTETGLEHWSRKNSVRAEEYIRKHDVVYQTVISASVFRRTFTAMKCCGHSFLRVINEIWMLLVRLVCMVGLFLSLFRLRNIKRCVRWVKNGLTDERPPRVVGEGDHIAFRKEEKKQWKFAIVISMIFFVVAFAIAIIKNYHAPSQKEQYLQLADEVTYSYSVDISAALTRIEVDRTLSDEEREQLYALFDKQIEVDRKILDYDMTELDDCLELHAGICSLCKDDIKMVESIRECLENNLVPSRELRQNYVSLRGKNYAWVLEELVKENLELTIDAFFNL